MYQWESLGLYHLLSRLRPVVRILRCVRILRDVHILNLHVPSVKLLQVFGILENFPVDATQERTNTNEHGQMPGSYQVSRHCLMIAVGWRVTYFAKPCVVYFFFVAFFFHGM